MFLDHNSEWVRDLLSDDSLKSSSCIDYDFSTKYVRKIFSTPHDKISQRDNQTFTYLLSTLILEELFVKRFKSQPDNNSISFSKEVNGEALPSV